MSIIELEVKLSNIASMSRALMTTPTGSSHAQRYHKSIDKLHREIVAAFKELGGK